MCGDYDVFVVVVGVAVGCVGRGVDVDVVAIDGGTGCAGVVVDSDGVVCVNVGGVVGIAYDVGVDVGDVVVGRVVTDTRGCDGTC